MGEDIREPKGLALKLAAAVAAFGVMWLALGGLPGDQRAVAAVFAAAVVLWVSEALPLAITALMSTVLLVLFGAATPQFAFAAYGDPIIMLFLGGFFLAKAMSVAGLDRRIALLLLSKKWATLTPSRVLLSVGVVTCVFSLFVSNTAVTAMMLPIGLSILKTMDVEKRDAPYANAMLLMLTWGASAAVGTIMATPPILISISLLERTEGIRIGFMEWMQFGMPITICMLLAAWLLVRFLYGRGAPSTETAREFAADEFVKLGPLKQSERNVFIAFCVALSLWLLPGLLRIALGGEHPWVELADARVPPPVAALIGAFLLFLLPSRDGESGRTLTWKRAATIDWGTILLFGGGIALGRVMLETGLAGTIGDSLAAIPGIETVWAITAVCVLTATLMSEFASNTASATTIVPIAIGLAVAADVSPVAPAIGAALGASLGFTLPISTPPNAIIYSSGLIPAHRIMKAGILLDIIGFFIIMFGLYLLLPIVGLV